MRHVHSLADPSKVRPMHPDLAELIKHTERWQNAQGAVAHPPVNTVDDEPEDVDEAGEHHADDAHMTPPRRSALRRSTPIGTDTFTAIADMATTAEHTAADDDDGEHVEHVDEKDDYIDVIDGEPLGDESEDALHDATSGTLMDDIDSYVGDDCDDSDACVATSVNYCPCERCKAPPIAISDDEDTGSVSDSSAFAARAPSDNPIKGGQKAPKKDDGEGDGKGNGQATNRKGKKGKKGKGKGKNKKGNTSKPVTAAAKTEARRRVSGKTPDPANGTVASSSGATGATPGKPPLGLKRKVPKVDVPKKTTDTKGDKLEQPGDPDDGGEQVMSTPLRPPFHVEHRKPSASRWGEAYLMQAPGPTKRSSVSITRKLTKGRTMHCRNNNA